MSQRALKPVVNESGIEVKPVYTPADVEATGGSGMIGLPGEFPFTRGIHPLSFPYTPTARNTDYFHPDEPVVPVGGSVFVYRPAGPVQIEPAGGNGKAAQAGLAPRSRTRNGMNRTLMAPTPSIVTPTPPRAASAGPNCFLSRNLRWAPGRPPRAGGGRLPLDGSTIVNSRQRSGSAATGSTFKEMDRN